MPPNVELREVRESDVRAFYGHQADPEAAAMAGQEPRPPESWIQPHKVASRRVAEKCGFAFDRIDGVYQVYRLD